MGRGKHAGLAGQMGLHMTDQANPMPLQAGGIDCCHRLAHLCQQGAVGGLHTLVEELFGTLLPQRRGQRTHIRPVMGEGGGVRVGGGAG